MLWLKKKKKSNIYKFLRCNVSLSFKYLKTAHLQYLLYYISYENFRVWLQIHKICFLMKLLICLNLLLCSNCNSCVKANEYFWNQILKMKFECFLICLFAIYQEKVHLPGVEFIFLNLHFFKILLLSSLFSGLWVLCKHSPGEVLYPQVALR